MTINFLFLKFFIFFRYGFREPPELDLALRPCFGGHSLGKYEGTISTVMKHLEKRLKIEFIKVLVCPNMDDEVLPFLHHVPYSLTEKNSNQQPTSIYVPKIKTSQSLQNVVQQSKTPSNNIPAVIATPNTSNLAAVPPVYFVTPGGSGASNFSCQN